MEEGSNMKRRKREEGSAVCIQKECVFKGPGEESFSTEPDESKRRDSSDPDQTPDRD